MRHRFANDPELRKRHANHLVTYNQAAKRQRAIFEIEQLPAKVVAALRKIARMRGQSVQELIASLLEAIVTDSLVQAVLDDG